MPDPVEYRDREGRTFSQYVADQMMAAIARSGMSVREVARLAGLNRETLRAHLHDSRSFTTHEIARIAHALDIHPADLVNAAGFDID